MQLFFRILPAKTIYRTNYAMNRYFYQTFIIFFPSPFLVRGETGFWKAAASVGVLRDFLLPGVDDDNLGENFVSKQCKLKIQLSFFYYAEYIFQQSKNRKFENVTQTWWICRLTQNSTKTLEKYIGLRFCRNMKSFIFEVYPKGLRW